MTSRDPNYIKGDSPTGGTPKGAVPAEPEWGEDLDEEAYQAWSVEVAAEDPPSKAAATKLAKRIRKTKDKK